jgi:predicted dehydrogenase
MAEALRVAVIGYGWMGETHSRAYARLRHHYPEAPLTPQLAVVSDVDGARCAEAAAKYGFERATTEWRDVLADPGVEAVSVTAPNNVHREIGVAVAEAGKHLWIEKPVGLCADDAHAVAAVVEKVGVQSAVGFNYRNVPAVAAAQAMIAGGEIGRVTHARVWLFSDYAAHPLGALSWRFERDLGGSGVIGDLASHGADLVHFLLGRVHRVVADSAVFIPQRPQPTGAAEHFAVASGGELGPVENEDFVSALIQTSSGARVTLEASRVSVGDQCNYGVEVRGTTGSVAWDFRRMGELAVCTGSDYLNQPMRTVFVGPGHGDYGMFQPGAGIAMSYDDLKVVEAARFVQSIATGTPAGATVADAVRSAQLLDAIETSARTGAWVDVDG